MKKSKIITLTLTCAMAAMTILPTSAMAANKTEYKPVNLNVSGYRVCNKIGSSADDITGFVKDTSYYECSYNSEKKNDIKNDTTFKVRSDFGTGNINVAAVTLTNFCKYYFDKDQAKYGSLCQDGDLTWKATYSTFASHLGSNVVDEYSCRKVLKEYLEKANFEGSSLSLNVGLKDPSYAISNNQPFIVFPNSKVYGIYPVLVLGEKKYMYNSESTKKYGLGYISSEYLLVANGVDNGLCYMHEDANMDSIDSLYVSIMK